MSSRPKVVVSVCFIYFSLSFHFIFYLCNNFAGYFCCCLDVFIKRGESSLTLAMNFM